MTRFASITALGWNALSHDVALPESSATAWLPLSQMDWRKDRRSGQVAAPQVDVTEIPSGLLIELRLPRLVKDSVYVGVRDNILTVTGEQAVPPPVDADIASSGRRFQRNFPLPPAPEPHHVKAFCHGEVLRIFVSRNGRGK